MLGWVSFLHEARADVQSLLMLKWNRNLLRPKCSSYGNIYRAAHQRVRVALIVENRFVFSTLCLGFVLMPPCGFFHLISLVEMSKGASDSALLCQWELPKTAQRCSSGFSAWPSEVLFFVLFFSFFCFGRPQSFSVEAREWFIHRERFIHERWIMSQLV